MFRHRPSDFDTRFDGPLIEALCKYHHRKFVSVACAEIRTQSMSMLLMVSAMKAKIGNPIRKLVLIKLADNANDDGECWPSYQHIADHCEIDKSTVRRHIKALEKLGVVKITNRKGPKGNTSNLYVICLHPVGTESTPPVGTVPTRTSHSLEPVIEHIVNPKTSFGDEFEALWQAYPCKKSENLSKCRYTKLAEQKGPSFIQWMFERDYQSGIINDCLPMSDWLKQEMGNESQSIRT